MASPLPKTKAPALAKKHRIWASSSGVAATARHAGAERLSHAGGAWATIATTPESRNSQRISDSVHAVVTAWTESEFLLLFLLSGVVVMVAQAPPAWLKRSAPACLAVAVTPELLAQILWFFTKAGAFVFGSGLAIVPFLHAGVVQELGWLNDKQFLDAVAVAMLTPGPVVITVAFIGYLVASVPGAVAASIGVFLPVYLFVVIPFPFFDRISANPKVGGIRGRGHGGGLRHHRGRLLRARAAGHHRRADAAHRPRRPRGVAPLQDSGTPAHRGRCRGGRHHRFPSLRRITMKWITRERARVDRIACPWLIRRFIDPRPEFLFVPAGQVMAVATREGAIPYDVPNVELGHQGPQCSFDAFIARYELDDAALTRLAVIVRGADTDDRRLTPESAGLYAAATGFQAISRDDADNMAHQFPLYDALYAFARLETSEVPPRSRVLFVCLHGAAKSVIAAAHFRRLAAARGLAIDAVAAGTEPDRGAGAGGGEGAGRGRASRGAGAAAPGHLARPGRAIRVVGFGCEVAPTHGQPLEQWDVPAVSDGYEAARDRIVANVERLVAGLGGGTLTCRSAPGIHRACRRMRSRAASTMPRSTSPRVGSTWPTPRTTPWTSSTSRRRSTSGARAIGAGIDAFEVTRAAPEALGRLTVGPGRERVLQGTRRARRCPTLQKLDRGGVTPTLRRKESRERPSVPPARRASRGGAAARA